MMDSRALVEEHVLKHEYDSAKAHAYYMRTRELTGRKKGTSKAKPPTPKRIEEDEVPEKSPTGAKIVDYNGAGPGRATYADGSTYDGNGWNKTGHDRSTRINAAQQVLMKAKNEAKKIKDPAMKATRLKRLAELQIALNAEKRKKLA